MQSITVYVVQSYEQVGIVLAQDPKAGITVAAGTSVHFNNPGGR